METKKLSLLFLTAIIFSITFLYAFKENKKSESVKVDEVQSILNNKKKNPGPGDIKSKWINTDTDLSIENLKGKVVLIEFWTFGCYNCKNTLPYVKDWYSKYGSDKFEVIGIHCPEFDNEKKFENVKSAVEDFGIKYPVLIDNGFTEWEKYDVHAWPTIIILDKEGEVRYTKVGEGSYKTTENKIAELISEN
ncbi:MAG: redoxin domain-containing protein [Ignavibacteria bacterium]